MAKSLLDTIKGQMQGSQQAAVPSLGETEQAQRLLRAKSGKQLPPSTTSPRASALGEKIAQQQAKLGAQQVQQKGKLAAETLESRQADIGQREQQQQLQAQEQRATFQDQAKRQTEALLSNFESRGLELQSTRDLAQLEQLGFGLRMQNEQYVKELQDAGARARLDTDVNFKEQIAKDAFGDQQSLLANDIFFKKMVDADDREFAQEIANININQALQIAEGQAKAASAARVASGAGSLLGAAVGSTSEPGFLSGLFGEEEE